MARRYETLTTNTEELTIPAPPVFVPSILNVGKMRLRGVTPTDANINNKQSENPQGTSHNYFKLTRTTSTLLLNFEAKQ